MNIYRPHPVTSPHATSLDYQCDRSAVTALYCDRWMTQINILTENLHKSFVSGGFGRGHSLGAFRDMMTCAQEARSLVR